MKVGDFLNELFDNIKDRIIYDSDVAALEKILEAIFKKDREKAMMKWKYLLDKYDIITLKKDIDFTPILKDFPTIILQTVNLAEFYKILDNIKYKNLIYEHVFNVFDKNSAIYALLNNLIIRKEVGKERETLKLIVKKANIFPKITFDLNILLKNIILFHLEQSEKNLDLLWEYTDIPEDIKEKSVLKTLLIDYL